MDTTYVSIMLVVFLVITGLAIDVGYLYVSEEDLKDTAESAALAGAQAMKQRLLLQMQRAPGRVNEVATDPVQPQARSAAIAVASGKHAAASLVELKNSNGNALSADNDLTVGFWNVSSQSYLPGGTPVNAMQVRTRRTAESSSVGMGSLGSFLAKITGTDSFDTTPVAVASLVPATRTHFAVCTDACDSACTYPNICTVPERKLSPGWEPGSNLPFSSRYLYTSLLHPVTVTTPLSEMICTEMPPQEVCGKPIYTGAGKPEMLADIAAMMYNPKVDPSNKQYDSRGRLVGWWMIVPATDCSQVKPGELFETRRVTRYSLLRISKICAKGAAGCQQGNAPRDVAATACSAAEGDGIYLDRISCVGCGSKEMMQLPGLQPVLVK